MGTQFKTFADCWNLYRNLCKFHFFFKQKVGLEVKSTKPIFLRPILKKTYNSCEYYWNVSPNSSSLVFWIRKHQCDQRIDLIIRNKWIKQSFVLPSKIFTQTALHFLYPPFTWRVRRFKLTPIRAFFCTVSWDFKRGIVEIYIFWIW